MNSLMPLENQLLVTKFYVPVRSGSLISRPRLTNLLNESLKYPLTLVSAAAGFGKTTLLASWSQSLSTRNLRVAWVSLDEEDNEPRLFWAYVLTALNRQEPGRFASFLTLLQSPQSPPFNTLLAELINLLVEGRETFLLILDDYHLITEQQVHTTLSYLIEHLPPQLRIIMATRADPAVPLAQLRARKQVLEVRTNQLRCTPEETKALLHEVMSLSLPEETIQEVTTLTEGWLVGLQLLSLSLPDWVNPEKLLKEISGDQRYILDYLTEEVLRRQPQKIQTFLLCTSILNERLTASLCDAVMEQTGSQQILHHIEQANLFVVSLDSKRQWYRYHDLFAQALRYQLEQRHADLVPILHHRASLWYAQHHQTTPAILHAFSAHQWQWAATLIEREHLPLISFAWGAGKQALILLRRWLEQLPADVLQSRPHLCLASAHMLWTVTPLPILLTWLNAAEVMFTTQTNTDASHQMLPAQMQQKQQNMLGEVIALRALLQSYAGDGQAVLSLCQQALSLLSEENFLVRVQVAFAQLFAYFHSSANNAAAAVESGLQSCSLSRAAGQTALSLNAMGLTASHMIGTGQLHKVQQLTHQAMLLGQQSGGIVLPEVGFASSVQADILREWNDLDAALSLAKEAILLCEQTTVLPSITYLLEGYAVLVRILLSRRDLEAAQLALQEFEHIGSSVNHHVYLEVRSHFTTVDQVRLWIACGELERAKHWVENLDLRERQGTPFAHEREDVAHIRVLLATNQSNLALPRLEAVLQRATVGQRWGHVIEIRLLQALAHQMCDEEMLALDSLLEAVRLAEPDGYIRSFIDEGSAMESLLYQLRRRNRKHGPTPYLDTLLAAFQQETKTPAQIGGPAKAYQLPEPLSERELEVLQLLVSGASNQEIAQELVIAVDTVKRHVSHIFSKLGVHNRMQAVLQARELGLLGEET